MLVEIHMLQNYAPNNLNRDDTGSPKRCIFGGIPRARISSQSLKYAIRKSPYFAKELEGVELGKRTRHLPDIVKDLLLKRGISEEMAEAAAKKATGFGNKDAKEQSNNITKQIMFFSDADIKNVTDILEKHIKASKDVKEFTKIKANVLQNEIKDLGIAKITPDISLFGRMITSDAFVDTEASMQVAHAISTNKIVNEFDFFTAVDDLKDRKEGMEEQGSAMMGDIEYNSSCFYKYFSFDTDQFIENFGTSQDSNMQDLLEKTLAAFLKSAIFTSPSGKQNTFAAHQLPALVAIVIRPMRSPISFANAFISPVKPFGKKDLVSASVEQLVQHIDVLTKKFGLEASKQLWFEGRDFSELKKAIPDGFEEVETLKKLLTSVKMHISGD